MVALTHAATNAARTAGLLWLKQSIPSVGCGNVWSPGEVHGSPVRSNVFSEPFNRSGRMGSS